ncbi:hypothetical protein OsccyDRAFT_3307 [Leptolyngbyaceae cyanobacterium JSC-12]|nr:hypothetical protein OsccyDRAFT_3307 [Leptolyngbyaceae cyanobacterium JSC-12]
MIEKLALGLVAECNLKNPWLGQTNSGWDKSIFVFLQKVRWLRVGYWQDILVFRCI